MSTENPTNKVNRRKFIGAAATTFAIPYVIPSGVLAAPGRPGANDRIVFGHIGVGGMGSSHIVSDAAAICDVDDDHAAAGAKHVTKGTPQLTRDYRHILDRKDIDAVTIGTPDHWHAIMTVHACQAGKDVYCEKPTARTVEEGRAMVNAARRYNRVVQIGSQGRSNPAHHAAAQYVRNGMIGKIERVDIWHPNNFTGGFGQEMPPPTNLDWDMWLGPARWVPYNPDRVHFNFRWFMDFGGGFIRDRGHHAINIVSWLTNLDAWDGLVTCEATGQPQVDSVRDVPVTMDVKWEFQNPAWTLTWSQPGKANPRFPGDWGATYTGDKGDLIVLGGDGGGDVEQKAKDYKVPAGGSELYLHPSNSDPTQRHRENWYDCIRTRKLPVMDVDLGRRVVNLCITGNIAYMLGRKVTFNTAAERFIGDEEANRMISEPYRSPFNL